MWFWLISGKICNNNDHTCLCIALSLARSLASCSNSLRRTQLMLMHEKNMCDPYSGLWILLHGVILLSEATSYEKICFLSFTSYRVDP